ncbi:TetR/AcrR family transcriptional regulator [Lentzea sp. NPDC051838]|uniref:TetR/AcrR family transcriptional regulator n=1 Tax=Lentzea sp. NPDC051838 TaxID=3154849 RepID=UPI00343A1EEC
MTQEPLAETRRRIMETAGRLFYRNGIQATGVGEIVETARVSKRSLYQLFASKDDLVAAYLRGLDDDGSVLNERGLDDLEVPARDRLLKLFDRPPISAGFRGCPWHNAAVELPDPEHPGRAEVLTHKRWTREHVTNAAKEIGARDPERLARHLITLYEGVMSLATSLDDSAPFDDARELALDLIEHA